MNLFSGDVNENDISIITTTTEAPETSQDAVQTQHDNPDTVSFIYFLIEHYFAAILILCYTFVSFLPTFLPLFLLFL